MDVWAISLLVPVALFVLIGTLFWLQKKFARDRLEKLAEVQKHFMDKFQSGRELAEFIETEAGRKFMEEIRGPAGPGPALGSIRFGIVFVCVGIAFLSMRAIVPHTDEDAIAAGLLFFAVGIGLIAAGGLSGYLARKWGAEDAAGASSGGRR